MSEKLMSVIGLYEGFSLDNPQVFIEQKQPLPTAKGHDLLVQVRAVSVNPVDVKLRRSTQAQQKLKILGFDGVGEVVAVGQKATKFQLGDTVFYAGSTQRSGSNQEYQLVDERIVALAPKMLSLEQAAALPLTGLTAYELLFEKFGLRAQEKANAGNILVINGSGGVGSILTQLAQWAGLSVYATASPHNFAWLQKMGVKTPIDYHQPLKESLPADLRFDYIAVLHDIAPYFEQLTPLIKPFGHLGTIVETA
ncbi:MAG: alcohol dehydrogenase catalytic domain-containing protein, partial [Enterococcus sp.]